MPLRIALLTPASSIPRGNAVTVASTVRGGAALVYHHPAAP